MDNGVASRETIQRFARELEGIEEEKEGLSEREKEVKEAAKAAGVDVKALATVVKERRKDKVESGREAREAIDGYHEMVD